MLGQLLWYASVAVAAARSPGRELYEQLEYVNNGGGECFVMQVTLLAISMFFNDFHRPHILNSPHVHLSLFTTSSAFTH